MQHSPELVATAQAIKRNRLIGQRRFADRRWLRERWAAERAVRPVRVVVRRVDLDDALELAAAEDQQPVEALPAQAPDLALGVCPRPRRSHRRLEDREAFGAEDLIEVARELAVAVADQEARPQPFVVESHQQVARLLGHPGAVGVSGGARDVHATACELNEEQDIEMLEEDVDGEEVALEEVVRVSGVIHVRRRVSAACADSSDKLRLSTNSLVGKSVGSSSNVSYVLIQAESSGSSPVGRCWMIRKARSSLWERPSKIELPGVSIGVTPSA